MLERIQETVNFLSNYFEESPTVGIVLGTGLGNLTEEIETDQKVSYTDIPNFPVSTVKGHSGNLIFGKLGGTQVVAMQGRFHFYEGYDMEEIVFPIRVMKALGINYLMLSNASGGVNPDFEIGEIMLISDHINLFPTSPLIGKNNDEVGPRFPDMSEPYSKTLIDEAKSIAHKNNIKVSEGVYAGLTGPCYETRAEYNYVRAIGADCVGMSTVPEVIAARHMGLSCFALSIITDLGIPGKIVEVSHEEVVEVAANQEPKMTLIIKELITSLK